MGKLESIKPNIIAFNADDCATMLNTGKRVQQAIVANAIIKNSKYELAWYPGIIEIEPESGTITINFTVNRKETGTKVKCKVVVDNEGSHLCLARCPTQLLTDVVDLDNDSRIAEILNYYMSV
jgi:hypothetical protein